MDGPLNKNARKVGKRGKPMTALELHAVIVDEIERHEHKVISGLQYVKLGDEWISVRDTETIERILYS